MSITQLPFLKFLSGGIALDNAPALCDDKSDGWLRYGQLREQVKSIAPLFQVKTPLFTTRPLILCSLPRTVQGAIAYLSGVASGHPLLLIDPGAARTDLFIAAYEPEWIVLSSALHPGDAYASVEWPLTDLFLWHRTTPVGQPIHDELFLLLQPPCPPESIKTVRLTYQNIICNTNASLNALGLNDTTRALLQMPLSYSFGLSILHMMLSVGGSVVLSEHDIKNRALWDLCQQRDATLFAGVPFHYEYLARAGIDNIHVPRLKTFLQAGGRMPPERTQEILRQVTARNGELFILYGQTEASPRISVLPLHQYPNKMGSQGCVIDGGELSAHEGRITYRGPNVMMGYAHGREDLALGDIQGGELQLHEHGIIDEDGFLFLE